MTGIADFAADDLLRFRATTGNELEDGSVLPLDAKLEFAGEWDVQTGQLVKNRSFACVWISY
jgi:hypothetical protein